MALDALKSVQSAAANAMYRGVDIDLIQTSLWLCAAEINRLQRDDVATPALTMATPETEGAATPSSSQASPHAVRGGSALSSSLQVRSPPQTPPQSRLQPVRDPPQRRVSSAGPHQRHARSYAQRPASSGSQRRVSPPQRPGSRSPPGHQLVTQADIMAAAEQARKSPSPASPAGTHRSEKRPARLLGTDEPSSLVVVRPPKSRPASAASMIIDSSQVSEQRVMQLCVLRIQRPLNNERTLAALCGVTVVLHGSCTHDAVRCVLSQLRREVSVGLLQSISTHSLNLTEMMGGLRSYENRPYRSEVHRRRTPSP